MRLTPARYFNACELFFAKQIPLSSLAKGCFLSFRIMLHAPLIGFLGGEAPPPLTHIWQCSLYSLYSLNSTAKISVRTYKLPTSDRNRFADHERIQRFISVRTFKLSIFWKKPFCCQALNALSSCVHSSFQLLIETVLLIMDESYAGGIFRRAADETNQEKVWDLVRSSNAKSNSEKKQSFQSGAMSRTTKFKYVAY